MPEFFGTVSAPQVTDVTPSAFAPDAVTNVTITGERFTPDSRIEVRGGATVSGVVVVSETEITATITTRAQTAASVRLFVVSRGLYSAPISVDVTDGGGGGSDAFLLDTFTDSNNTALPSHMGEVGATWGALPTLESNPSHLEIVANGAQIIADVIGGTAVATGESSTSNQRVLATIHRNVVANPASQQALLYLLLRVDEDGYDSVGILWNTESDGQVYVVINDDTPNQVGIAFAPGSTIALEIVAADGSIAVSVDNMPILAADAIGTGRRVGVTVLRFALDEDADVTNAMLTLDRLEGQSL